MWEKSDWPTIRTIFRRSPHAIPMAMERERITLSPQREQ